ncbi:MAG: lamin tail domain-containing protein, partial [Phycisphaerae bacterium]
MDPDSRQPESPRDPPRLEPMEPRLLLDGSVIINELHVDPDVKTELVEYVEIYNRTADPIDVSGWFFSDGIAYTFPGGTTLPGHGYLVVSQDPSAVAAKFGVSSLGPFAGRLANEGECVTLRDETGAVADEVDYGAGFPWPTVGDAPGYSMELIHPDLDNDLGANWRSSGSTVADPVVFIDAQQEWRYVKGWAEPSSPTNAWRQLGFDDSPASGWSTGDAAVGYSSDPDELDFIGTKLTDMRYNYSTVYMRKAFTVDNPAAIPALELLTRYDDGINVWINGRPVLDLNVDGTELPYDATARSAIDNVEFVPNTLTDPDPRTYLVAGTNVIAVQLLNASLSSSSDAFFDAILRTAPGGTTAVTPGAVNSVYAANAPPQMRHVDHAPNEPEPGEDVAVTMKVTDPDGVAGVTLAYQTVDPGDYINLDDPRYDDPAYWTTVPMYDDGTHGDAEAGDADYTAVIPAAVQTNRRLVRYRVTAADGLGASVTAPYADDPQPNFAYYVYAGAPAWTGSARPGTEPAVEYSSDLLEGLPVYTLVTRRQDALNAMRVPYRWGEADQELPTSGEYWGSDYKWQGTLVYDGVVYDHIRYRARGGCWRYSMGKNMWKFDFNRNHWFQARDDYGETYDTTWDKLNFSALIQQGNFGQRGEQGLFEAAGFALHNLADNPAPYTNYLHFRLVDDADEGGPDQFSTDFQGLYMTIEQPDGRLLDEHGLADGNFYKMESGTGTLNNQGPTHPTDKSDLNAFMNGYRSSPDAAWCEANLHLEDYYSFRAIAMAIHDYDMHAGKNYFYYHDPETDKWRVINWDIDLTWTTTYNGGGGQGPLYDDSPYVHLLDLSQLRVAYNNRVREIVDLLFNAEQTGMLLDEIASFVYTPGEASFVDADRAMWDYNPILVSDYVNLSKAGHGRFYGNSPTGDFAGMVQILKDYVQNKVDGYLAGQDYAFDPRVASDEGLQPDTPTITYTGPAGYAADQLTFHCSTFSGSGTFAGMEWRLAEVSVPGTPEFDPDEPRHYEIDADWQSGELATFDPDVALPADAAETGKRYRVRARMKDSAGRYSHWSDPVEFVAGTPVGSDVPLRITEIMFNPPDRNPAPGHAEAPYGDNDYFEYIELKNIGGAPVDLAGVRFTDGIQFTFPAITLDPGEFVLVVADQDAFEARYGTGRNVAGEFEDDTGLSNGGEDLRLEDAAGLAIHTFEFKDGWFGLTDGDGYSLVPRDPAQDAALWSTADGWRTSWQMGGSPGAADAGIDPASVVVNETLAHSNGPEGDWVELYNASDAPVDLAGWFLSDSALDLAKYEITADAVGIPDTVLGPGAYLVLNERDHFGPESTDPGRHTPFALSEFGEDVYLTAAVAEADVHLAGAPGDWPAGWSLGGYREDEHFGATPADESLGRFDKPSGGKDFVLSSAPTPGAANAGPLIPDVVLNEIMYHPPTEPLHEYVELHNRTAADVALWNHFEPGGEYDPMDVGWALTDGVDFTFPVGASVPAGGYALVVAIDPATFRSTYGIDVSVPIYGPFENDTRLSNGGERVALSRPGQPETKTPPPGQTAPYVPYIEIEKVSYNDAAPWPTDPDGLGPSLDRIGPPLYANDPTHWGASADDGGTPGAANQATPPHVTGVVLNPDPARTLRTLGDIE